MFWYKLTGAGLLSLGLLFSTGTSALASCPAATVADMKGVKAGKYPQQFELTEFERNAGCKMTFQRNPVIAKLNAKIRRNTRNFLLLSSVCLQSPWFMHPMTPLGNTAEHWMFSQMLPRQEHLISYRSDTSTWFDTWMTWQPLFLMSPKTGNGTLILPNWPFTWEKARSDLTVTPSPRKMWSSGTIISRWIRRSWKSPKIT